MNVLFVCTGNICRSPMAEHLFRRMLVESSRTGIEVRSAGTEADIGFPKEARAALEKEHVTGVQHESRSLSPELVEWADLILTMEAHHRRTVIDRFPKAKQKTYVLNAYAGLGDETMGIRDPYGGSFAVYESTLVHIKRALQKILEKFEKGADRVSEN